MDVPTSDSSTELTCREFVEIVTAYLDDALPAEDRVRFEEHMKTCVGCDTFFDQIKETVQLVGRLDEMSISPEAQQVLLGEFRNWKDGD